MTTKEELEEYAEKIQKIQTELMNGPSFDAIREVESSSIKKILVQYFPENAAEQLFRKFQIRNNDLIFKIIIVNCFADDKSFDYPVVRVLEGERAVFYDGSCRKYKHWEDFLSSNVLPECQMLYPKNGTYENDGDVILLEKGQSPAKGILRKIGKFLYEGADKLSLIAIFLPMFSFANPFVIVSKVLVGIANGYKICHHTYALFDRFVHDQSINLSDKTAAQRWYLIAKEIIAFSFTWIQTEYVKTIDSFSVKNILLVLDEIVKNALSSLLNIVSGIIKAIFKMVLDLYRFGNSVEDKSFRRLSISNDVHAINNKMLKFLYINNVVMDDIVEEINIWKIGDISNEQLKFRTTEICRGGKKYETLSEMCSYYGVDSIDEVHVNGRKIFGNLENGNLELETLVENASGRYPMLLWYAFLYASEQHDSGNWSDFKDFFQKRIYEESLNELTFIGNGNEIEWQNTIDEEDLNFTWSSEKTVVFFVNPKNSFSPVLIQDKVILIKRFLGTFEYEVCVVKEDFEWIMMVSKEKKKAFILGPNMLFQKSVPIRSYPLWIIQL